MKKLLTSRFGLTAIVSLTILPTVFAQGTTPVTPPAASATPALTPAEQTATTTSKVVKPSEYRISIEDHLVITCLNSADFNTSATVLPDGTISYPKMGQIKVVGKTLKQVEKEIVAFLKKTEFLRPQVSVGVTERQVRQVSITGTGIKTGGGKHVMRDGWRVLDALSDSGGLLSDRYDLFTAKLIRYETGEVIPIDLVSIYSNNNSDANMLLEPNDVLIVDAVDESKSQVLISGEVMKPGSVLIPRDGTISKALDAAGGVNKQSALLSGALIERNGEKIPLDLTLLVTKGTEPAQRLQPGDKLIVPENKQLVYLIGAVAKQGATLIPEDRPLTLIQALSDASVPLQNAETKKTQIRRPNADGTQTVTTVNVEEILKKADYTKDVQLKPGDIVYVPFKAGHKFGVGDALGTLGSVANLRWLTMGW